METSSISSTLNYWPLPMLVIYSFSPPLSSLARVISFLQHGGYIQLLLLSSLSELGLFHWIAWWALLQPRRPKIAAYVSKISAKLRERWFSSSSSSLLNCLLLHTPLLSNPMKQCVRSLVTKKDSVLSSAHHQPFHLVRSIESSRQVIRKALF